MFYFYQHSHESTLACCSKIIHSPRCRVAPFFLTNATVRPNHTLFSISLILVRVSVLNRLEPSRVLVISLRLSRIVIRLDLLAHDLDNLQVLPGLEFDKHALQHNHVLLLTRPWAKTDE